MTGIADAGFGKQLTDTFANLSQSREIVLEEWRKRPLVAPRAG